MNIDIQNLITGAIATFSSHALVILAAIIGLLVGILVFKYGLNKLMYDRSLEIGGYYLRDVPYKGYNRWRSKRWNMEHMP